MPNDPHIFWDSDVFISRIERTPGRIEVLEEITNAAERGEIFIITSSYTMVEVCKLTTMALEDDETERLIEDFFENPYIVVRQVDREVAKLARAIIRSHSGIKPGDGVQIATAVSVGVDVMQTYDEQLLKKSGLIGKRPLRIEIPQWEKQMQIPFPDDTDK